MSCWPPGSSLDLIVAFGLALPGAAGCGAGTSTLERPAASESGQPPAPEATAAEPARLESTAAQVDDPGALDGALAPSADVSVEQRGAPPAPRDVLYKVTPGGLVVDIDGMRFKPKATVTKLRGGAMGIHIEVIAEAIDERTHVLLKPEHGPLSLAETVSMKNGNLLRHTADRREGNDQLFVMPGAPVTFTRDWPSGEFERPLFWGQRLRLDVGLWGLGSDDDVARSLRAFFVVQLVGDAKASAAIVPPEL